jgi:hypothetical protein
MQGDRARRPKALFQAPRHGRSRALHSGVHRLLAIFFLSQIVHGQSLSFGIVAGGSVTDDFNIAAGYPLVEYSTPRRYVVGGMIELALKAGWSLELDGLFHPLGFSSAVSPATVVTWELPVMAKYRFSGRRFTPFLEGGAAFRTTGNLNATDPSHTGVIAGAGVEVPFGRFRISPEVRYIHWAADSSFGVTTISNQVELLAAFSTGPSGRRRFFGPRVSFGAAAGATLTPDFATYQFNGITTSGTTSIPFMDTSASGPRSLIGGPEVEVCLGGGFSVEADAIYRPERLQGTFDVNGMSNSYNKSVTTWQFPLLGKYRIGHGRFQPFLEAGPSFRLRSGLANAASYGATGAAGVETHLSRLVIAPAVRFSRWGPNISEIVNEVRNEVELLAGFTF